MLHLLGGIMTILQKILNKKANAVALLKNQTNAKDLEVIAKHNLLHDHS
jgi:hypothetical protein